MGIVKHTLPSKMVSEEMAKNLTPRERMIYQMLVGNSTFPATQSTIHQRTGIPKSTVNDIVSKLLNARAIAKPSGAKRCIFYRKAVNHFIVDRYVELDIKQGLYTEFGNDLVVKAGAVAPPIHFLRAHLNGGWIDVNVLKEGELKRFNAGDTIVTLFGEQGLKPGMKGLLAVNGSTFINGDWPSIRYQKGINTGTMVFGIAPKHLLLPSSSIQADVSQIHSLFFGIISPFFNTMEKYGGWIFEKNESNQFKFRCKANPEFGFDGDLTRLLTDALGGCVGIPGDPIFNDHSDPAGPDGEVETSLPEMVDAIHNLPQHVAQIYQNSEELGDIVPRVFALEKTVAEIQRNQNIKKKTGE